VPEARPGAGRLNLVRMRPVILVGRRTP